MSGQSTKWDVTRAEVCVVACAEVWRGGGSILASPIGLIPRLGAQLAQLTFEPDLLLVNGDSLLVDADGNVEGWMPISELISTISTGKRHVMMGAAQIDRYGNQNISVIGEWNAPKAQLLGSRAAPGNTINHATSYWIGHHSRRIFVEKVDMVCGIGADRGAVDLRAVITDLGVLDFNSPERRMRVRSVHPGVTVDEVVAATGFDLVIPAEVPITRLPTDEELVIIRKRLDPQGLRNSAI